MHKESQIIRHFKYFDMKFNKRKVFFGSNLRHLRKNSGMKQSDLGETIGVQANTISGYETGKSTPELRAFLEIVELFEISADTLLFFDISNLPSDPATKATPGIPGEIDLETASLKQQLNKSIIEIRELTEHLSSYKNDLFALQRQVAELAGIPENKKENKKKVPNV